MKQPKKNKIMKQSTITRKIELRINQENYKDVFKTLYEWQEIVFRGSNYISTHMYVQENLKEFFYFNEEFKLNLSNKEDGVMNTSKQNSTYQVLSDKFKGDIPTSILAEMNSRISSTFGKLRKDYFSGKRSLSTFKRDTPIPIGSKDMKNFVFNEETKNYEFDLFKFKFSTYFGRDLSKNKEIMQRAITDFEDYKLCGSSIQLSGKKIFLLLVVQFTSDKQINSDKSAVIRLDINHPIVVSNGKKDFFIGTKEEFLHRRLAIQQARRRTQHALQYVPGGKGRKKKLKGLEQFEEQEKNYVQTKLHTYSKNLIDYCVKNNIGKLYIANQDEEMKNLTEQIKMINQNEELSKHEKNELIEKQKFVLANWSYYGLLEKVKYKANQYGIEIEQLK
jgi:transposase